MGRVTARERILRIREGVESERVDTLVVEEPLEIRLDGTPLSVTMRTPGSDFDLAAGFLVSEGVVSAGREVSAIRYCAGATEDGSNTYNVLDVSLAPGVPLPDTSLERNFYTSSSCGLCGKASLDAVRTKARWPVAGDGLRIGVPTLTELPERLRESQRVFDRTGGLHAAGLFTAGGELLALREDVGRHNAVDKVIGWAATNRRLPLHGHALMVSGRIAFEIAQKALVAGFPLVAAVSAAGGIGIVQPISMMFVHGHDLREVAARLLHPDHVLDLGEACAEHQPAGDLGDGEVHDVPLDAVGHPHHDVIAGPEPQRQQAVGVAVAAVHRLARRRRHHAGRRGDGVAHPPALHQAIVARLGVEDWIAIEGVIAGEAKRVFLQQAEGYVHPSRWECHSTALLENLALGVPSLVSSSIHIAAPLASEEAALLTPPAADAIAVKLLELRQRGAELGPRAREFVRRRFAWERVIPAYREALAGHNMG